MRKTLVTITIILGVILVGILVYVYLVPNLSTENREIKAWISENNLNKFGDQKNTVYSNGKPCSTTLGCFDYIKKMHVDSPWMK